MVVGYIGTLALYAFTFGAYGSELLGQTEMASDDAAPMAFSFRSRVDVPWIAMLTITILAIGLTALGGLELIAAFSSMTFLIVSLAVSIANFRLRNQAGSRPAIIVTGMVLILATIVIMCELLAITSKKPTTVSMSLNRSCAAKRYCDQ